MKNEKEIIICVGLGVMVVDTAEDAAAVEIMDGAGIAVEITEEIPIGEVSTMVMQSAIGMAMMPEETASLAAAAAIMAAVAAETREGDSICTRCELRERKPGGESCPAFFPSVIKNSKNTLKIGATGFEPATSRPPAERATKLRHTPGTEIIIPETGKKATGKYRQKHTEKEKDPQIPQVLSKPEPSGTFSDRMELTLLPSALHSPRGSQTLWPP